MRPGTERLDLLFRLEEMCARMGTGGANTREKLRNLALALNAPPPAGSLEAALEELELYWSDESGNNTP